MKNVFNKVNQLRSAISQQPLHKTGYNPHSKHKFFELSDFLDTTKAICYELQLATKFDIIGDEAILTVFDIESGESLEFKTLYKNTTNIKDEIQSLGSSMTYLRRYLYVDLLELVENDTIDNTNYTKTPKQQEITRNNHTASYESNSGEVHIQQEQPQRQQPQRNNTVRVEKFTGKEPKDLYNQKFQYDFNEGQGLYQIAYDKSSKAWSWKLKETLNGNPPVEFATELE